MRAATTIGAGLTSDRTRSSRRQLGSDILRVSRHPTSGDTRFYFWRSKKLSQQNSSSSSRTTIIELSCLSHTLRSAVVAGARERECDAITAPPIAPSSVLPRSYGIVKFSHNLLVSRRPSLLPYYFKFLVILGEQQPAMLETLLKHLETAATNGTAEAPAAEKAAEKTEEPKKDDAAAPAEVSRRLRPSSCINSPYLVKSPITWGKKKIVAVHE